MQVLTDIAGEEDHYGDMDFKVAGTREGITALQMDIKIGGLKPELMAQALEQAKAGRLHILDRMLEALAQPRTDISPFAPRILTIQVPVDKIRDIIGPGGKMIRSIVERTGCKIDVEDDGRVSIASVDESAARKAIAIIEELTATPELNKTYLGKVVRVVEFGAFVEILPGHRRPAARLRDGPPPRPERARRGEGRRPGARQGRQHRPVRQDPSLPQGPPRGGAGRGGRRRRLGRRRRQPQGEGAPAGGQGHDRPHAAATATAAVTTATRRPPAGGGRRHDRRPGGGGHGRGPGGGGGDTAAIAAGRP